MAKRNSKTAAQQCRYYEVDNIFVYMVETYINGNFETFRRLYHELNKDARRAVSYKHLSSSGAMRICGALRTTMIYYDLNSSLLI